MGRFIKGITIELGGETQKLGQALAGVEKQSRDLQSELRQVERLLKLDPKNTELLAQKQKLLAESVTATKDRLATLKIAQEQAAEAFAKGEIGEQQYRAIQREVIAAEEKLKSLEAQLETTNSKWEAAAKGIGEFGEGATKLGKKIAPVSAAAGAAAAGMVAMATKSALAADDLNTLSAQTGLSTSTLQKFQYATDVIDVSMDTMTKSLSRLTRSMRDSRAGNKQLQDTFKKLMVPVTDSTGKLRDNEEVLYDLVDALGRVQNETERDALSMQIFGRSAQELNPLIMGGAEQLRKLGDEAQRLGLILDQETLDEINKLNDELDIAKAQLSGTARVLGATIAQVVLPMVQKLTQGLQNVLSWFRKLDPTTAKVILVVLGLVAALAPLLIMIGKVATGISAVMTLMAKMGPVMAALKTAFAALTGPIGIVIAAIAALIAIGVLLVKNWDKIKETAEKVFKAVGDFIGDTVESIKGFFQGLINKGAEMIEKFKNIGKDIVKGIWEGIKSMGQWLTDKVKDFFNGIVGGIKKLLGISSPSKLFADVIGANMAAGVGLGFSQKMVDVSRSIASDLSSVADFDIPVPGGRPSGRGGTSGGVGIAGSGGYGTANIVFEVDGRALAKAIGQPLVDTIRIKTGMRR